MIAMFKLGDRVICVNNTDYESELKLGAVYVVSRVYGDNTRVDLLGSYVMGSYGQQSYNWIARRFVLACGLAKVLYSIGADEDEV